MDVPAFAIPINPKGFSTELPADYFRAAMGAVPAYCYTNYLCAGF